MDMRVLDPGEDFFQMTDLRNVHKGRLAERAVFKAGLIINVHGKGSFQDVDGEEWEPVVDIAILT